MNKEPDIVRELREKEKIGLLYDSIVQNNYIDSNGNISDEKQIEINIFEGNNNGTKEIIENHSSDEIWSDNIYKSIFEFSPDSIIIVDLDGKVINCNTVAAKLFGFSKDEMIGRFFTDICRLKGKETIRYFKLIDSISRDGINRSIELEFQHKDGSSFTCKVQIGVIKTDAGDIFFQLIIHDVMEKKTNKVVLDYDEDVYRLIAENTSDMVGLLTFNLDPTFVYVNSSLRSLGYEPEELIGKKALEFIHPKDKTELKSLLKKYIIMKMRRLLTGKEREFTERLEYRFKDKSGNWHYIQSTFNIIGNNLLFISRDITDHKYMEEQLREAKCRFEDIVMSSADFIWEIDSDCRYTYTAGRTKKIFGYSPDELIGKTPFDFMPKEEVERLRPLFQKISSEKKPIVNLENWNLTKDGKKICLLTNGIPILDESGRLLGYRGVDKDITESKFMEIKLRESEEKFRTIASTAYDAIIMTDDNGEVTYWNKAAEHMFGYRQEEIIGKNLHYVVAPKKFHEMFLKGFEIFKKTGKGAAIGKILELEALRKDGTEFPVELSLSSVKLDNRWYAVGIVRDTTQRKEIERKLRESEEKYRALVEQSSQGIAVIKYPPRFVFVNERLSEMLGYTTDELLSLKSEEIGNLVHPDDRAVILDNFRRRFDGESPPSRYEFRAVRKDGKVIYIELSVKFIEYQGEMALQATYNDITDRKEVEEKLFEAHEKLREINRNLEDKVRERTREVERLLQQKDGFISQLGHDLKTPLTPLLALLPIIRKRVDDPKVQELLDTVIQSAIYMKNLITRLLQLAKLNSPSTKFHFEDVNLLDEINSVLDRYEMVFQEHNIEVENLVDDGIVVSVDRLHFSEVVDNLVSNAVKYSPGGGRISIKAELEGGMVRVAVSDTGMGMTSEQLEHIFDEFYKVDESRHDFESSGVGLSICKKIVERHGGRIWAESPGLGKGSTFYFTIKTAKQ